MNNIRQVRDIVRLLNKEFPPRDIVNETWSGGKVFSTTVVKRKPHFIGCCNKYWTLYCDNMEVWRDEYFQSFKQEIVKMMAKQGIRVKFDLAHPVTVEIKINSKKYAIIAPERIVEKYTQS